MCLIPINSFLFLLGVIHRMSASEVSAILELFDPFCPIVNIFPNDAPLDFLLIRADFNSPLPCSSNN
jgi:hypothetical protein